MEETPLSREDRAILDLEGPTIVGHTCKLVVVEPPAPTVEALRHSVETRIGAAPELTRRLAGSGDRPSWIEDGEFDIRRHIVESAGPIVAADLPQRVAELFAEHLDRGRPLWRIDAVELEDGRLALIWRIHHALADGTAAMRFGEAVLWDAVEAGTEHERAPRPPAHRSPAGGPADADHERRRGHLAALLRREFGESLHASPFDGEVGSRRSVAFASAPFAPLHDAAKRLDGATINDAVLSVVAGAIGRWLEHHDRELGSLRLRVPVSLHHEGDEAANRDSFFTLPVPVSEPDPVRRLQRIHSGTSERKAGHDAEQLESLLDSLGAVSGRARELAERLEASPRNFALAVSNVRGPGRPIEVCGAAVESLHSLAEIGGRHGLRVSVVSLAGTLNFGFCGDPGIAPDLGAMARGVDSEVEALLAAA